MNFKTTILLLIVLVVVGAIFFFTGSNKPADQTTQENTQVTPGQGEKIINVQSSQVQGLTITDAQGNRTAVRQDGATWKMTAPTDAPAVDWQTQDLIRSICDLRSQGKPASTPADSGLDTPRYTVDLIDSAGKSTRLVIGNPTSIGDTVYAQVDGGDVNLIDSSLVKTLKTAGDDLRDKHLLGTASADYKQLTITTPGQTLSMQKEGDHWIITSPTRMPGDSESISSMISSITGTEATEFVKSDSEDLAFAGFDHPTMQISLGTGAPSSAAPSSQPSTDSTTRPAPLILTIGAPDSLSKDHYFVRTSTGLVGKIAKSSLDNLTKSPLDLRDRDVVSITPAEVSQLSVVKTVYPPVSTTQATQPSVVAANIHPMSTHLTVLVRRPKIAAKLGPAPASKPSTQPAATQPVQSAWMFAIPSEPDRAVDDSKVDALLEKFSPLRADKYLEKAPESAIDQRFIITIETRSLSKYHIEVTKPANGQTTYGTYNGLTFELPTAFTDAIDTDFHKQP